jgi:tetratricopeptide (TPR) repeat protein
MISVFQGADPEISGRRDLLVSELLDAGRERLASNLGDQPQTRAEITGILGSIYHTIGKRAQALKMFEEAIQLERGNNRPAALADLLYKQAYTVYDLEDFPKALPLAEEVLKLREKIAPESLETLNALLLVGNIHSYLDNAAAANLVLTRAIAMAEKLTGTTSVETGRALLAFAHKRLTVYAGAADAAAYSERARRIFAQKLGDTHYLYANALEVLGLALSAQGKYAEAVPMGKQLSDIRTKTYGELSNQNGFGLFTYANFLRQAGHRLDAISIYERCVAIQEKLDGRATLATMQPLWFLAKTKFAAGDYTGALPLIEEVVAIRAKAFPADNSEVLRALFDKGQILRHLGRLTEAERVTHAVLKAWLAKENTQKQRIHQSHLELAAVYRLQGRFDAAEAEWVAAQGVGSALSAESKALVLAEKARLYAAQGRLGEALKLQLEAEELLDNDGRESHPDTQLQKLDRAELLVKMGRRQAARDLARQISERAKPSIEPTGEFAKRLAKLTV